MVVEDIISPNIETAGKCTRCSYWKTSQTGGGLYSCNCLMGQGSGSIMFIDSSPRENEIKSKIPFVGIEGQILKKCASVVGISEGYYTYVVKCKPPVTPDGKLVKIGYSEMDACAQYLIDEIKRINPKVIVALGNTVLEFFEIEKSITKARGIPIWDEEFKCYILPTYSPTYINNFTDMSSQRREFIEDLAKAYKIAYGEGIAPKQEVSYKCASTIAEVEWMTNQLLQTDIFSADTETTSLDYFKAKLLMASFTPEPTKGFVIPYAHPNGFNEQGQKEVKQCLKKIFESPVKKIFQHGKFDIQIMMGQGIQTAGVYFDTCLAHALLDENSPHGLDIIASTYTDMGDYKDEVKGYIKGKVNILNSGIFQENKINWRNVTLEESHSLEFQKAIKRKSTTYKCFENVWRKKATAVESYRKSTILDCSYEKLWWYAAQDTDATFRGYLKMLPILEKEGLLPLLLKVSVPLSIVLARMEFFGIGGDLKYASEKSKEMDKAYEEAKQAILKSPQIRAYKQKYNSEFNPQSPKQKSELLFDIMGLKPLKLTKVTAAQRAKGIKKGNPSTDSEALGRLLKENKVKVLEDLIVMGGLKKQREYIQDYVDILTNSFDGRIHTSYNQIKDIEADFGDGGGTATGRLSSSGPNLQNIPSHDPEKAKFIRKVFVARPGYTFIESDYSVVEFRAWGHASGDPKMLDFLNTPGADIHKKIASQAFKLPEDQITKKLRDIAKQTVYGMVYGRGTYSIAKEYGMDQAEVDRFVSGFFKMFPEATQYLESQAGLMAQQGYTTNIFGRRRRALNIFSKDKFLRSSAERQARNFPFQSAAADVIFVAMIKLDKALSKYGTEVKMLLQIHDSLVVEIKDELLEEVIPLVVQTMETAVPLRCKIPVEVEYGKNLGEMELWVPKEERKNLS